MKVVLMDTGRGTHAGVIATWREKLKLDDDDVVSLLTWHAPKEPLPVQEHLVFGPHFSPRRTEPRRSETAFDLFGDADIDRAAMTDAGGREDPAAGEEDASLSGVDLAEQLPESTVDAHSLPEPPDDTETDDTETAPGPAGAGARPVPPSLTSLPVTHPARLRQAAKWRANKARLAARGAYRRGKGWARRNRSAPARALKTALGIKSDGIAAQFALSVMRSHEAADVFGRADLVMPMDARSQRAAWVLARKVAGPDVVVGYPAAIRCLSERRAAATG